MEDGRNVRGSCLSEKRMEVQGDFSSWNWTYYDIYVILILWNEESRSA